jgi:hypothetical protein
MVHIVLTLYVKDKLRNTFTSIEITLGESSKGLVIIKP